MDTQIPGIPADPGPGARDAEFNDPALRALGQGPVAPLEKGHPRGLYSLFMTEMWERFSFYGMKALLVLFLITVISPESLSPGVYDTALAFRNDTESAQVIRRHSIAVRTDAPPSPAPAEPAAGALRVSPDTPPVTVYQGPKKEQISAASTEYTLTNTSGAELRYTVSLVRETDDQNRAKPLLLSINDGTSPVSGALQPGESTTIRAAVNPSGSGRAWTKKRSGTLMGWYAGLVYLTPLIGGYLADRFLGTRRAMLMGGSIIAAGHFTLMLNTLPSLYIGLLLVIIGTGLFKPNVSIMVGQLYRPGDPRRDAGFTIFYMGINLGAFIAPLICGWLRTNFGWSWGFGAAGVGMVLGLIQFSFAKNTHLAGIGLPPREKGSIAGFAATLLVGAVLLALASALCFPEYVPPVDWMYTTIKASTYLTIGVPLLIALAVIAGITAFCANQKPDDRGPVASIFIMAFFVIFFWTAFEQSGNSLAFFAQERTDRSLPAMLNFLGEESADSAAAADAAAIAAATPPADQAATAPGSAPARTHLFPAEWFQSLNPLLILMLAPIFSILWVRMGRMRRPPSTPLKMACGLILVGLGFLFMVFAARFSEGGFKVSPFWLSATFVVLTCGELCLSPVGLSFVTKLAPVMYASLLMGVWFLANFVANLAAGLFAAQIDHIAEGEGFWLGGWADFFIILVLAPVAAGLLLVALVPLLKIIMRGRA